jgi:hypothetical protein
LYIGAFLLGKAYILMRCSWNIEELIKRCSWFYDEVVQNMFVNLFVFEIHEKSVREKKEKVNINKKCSFNATYEKHEKREKI